MLVPHRYFRCFAAIMEIFFQFCIVGTGNYAWINYVGILPCIALFDDGFIEIVEKKALQPICDIMYLVIEKILMVGKLLVPIFLIGEDLNDDSCIDNLSDDEKNEVKDIITKELENKFCGERTKNEVTNASISFIDKMTIAFRNGLACFIETIHRVSIFCLLVFMIYKAKDPIKELFGPAPWINAYDDYFFMTSQGTIQKSNF